jgi:acid phosphatase type 7
MTDTARRAALIIAVVVILVAAGVLAVLRPWEAEEAPSPDASAEGAATVFAVGDIARCSDDGDEETAEIVETVPDATVLALGDLAYNNGSAEDFEECYDPSWGAFRDRTRPVPGNHEYRTDEAQPYYDYFGSRAGESGKGWYSFDLGEWHIVALNSNCDDVGCDEGSEQEQWLRADLEENAARCTLAFWHAPRFSSGAEHGGTRSVKDLWQVLLDNDVELLLAGHEHLYERTAPLDEDGNVDEQNGVRQFVVGTGGGNFYPLGERITGSEAAIVDVNGVLRMTLEPGGYDWEFVPVEAGADSDTGTGECR